MKTSEVERLFYDVNESLYYWRPPNYPIAKTDDWTIVVGFAVPLIASLGC